MLSLPAFLPYSCSDRGAGDVDELPRQRYDEITELARLAGLADEKLSLRLLKMSKPTDEA